MSSSSSINHSTARKRKDSSPVDLPYLPDELLLNCLARVSRLYYPTLSLVSKRFGSLVVSKDLYETRTLLGRTESCLYVYLLFPLSSDPLRWFTLCRRPTQILNPNPNPNSRWFTHCFRPYSKKEKKSSDNILVPLPARRFSPPSWNATAVGSNIYNIGEDIYNEPSSGVFFMDCRSHVWHKAPSMRIYGEYHKVIALDGKIYVVKGMETLTPDFSNPIECFDTKTQTWEFVPSPSVEIRGTYITNTLAIDGKLYLFGDKSVVYKPEENRWDAVGWEACVFWRKSACVIDNIVYRYGWTKMLEWYDFEERSWKVLKGVGRLPNLPEYCTRLVNYGGKIAVLWEKSARLKKMIWCAEISLERRNKEEIYGKVEWCDVVLSVPKSCNFLQFVAVTV